MYKLLGTMYKLLGTINTNDSCYGVGLAEQVLALVMTDRILLLNLSHGAISLALTDHKPAPTNPRFSPNGQTLCIGSEQPHINVYNLSRQTTKKLLGHQRGVQGIAFAPDGKTLASSSLDHTIKLWDLATGVEIATLKGHSDWVNSVAFSADGQWLASSGTDDTIRLWNLKQMVQSDCIKAHSNLEGEVIFGFGQSIAWSSDNKIHVWNLSTKKVTSLRGHTDYILSLAFSHRQGLLASCSQDGAIFLWDFVENSATSIPPHQDSATGVAFTPNGQYLATCSLDGTAKLWQIKKASHNM